MPILVGAVAFPGELGEGAAFVLDITARKAEAALLQKAEVLRASNAELEQFNRAMVGRELRMIELKQEINELCRRLGEPPRHETPPDRGRESGMAAPPPSEPDWRISRIRLSSC